MKREEAESELDFIGFIIFENKLKPTTAGVLDELSEAGIRKVMCTGDNILTAISVARECNLIDKTAHCFVPHFAEGRSTPECFGCPNSLLGDFQDPKARLSWESIDNNIYTLDENTLTVRIPSHPLNSTNMFSHYRHPQKETPLSPTIYLISEITPLQ